MKILLNPDLKTTQLRSRTANRDKVAERLVMRTTDEQLETIKPFDEHLTTHFGLIGTASKAYSAHYGLTIAPQDVWFTILSEIGGKVAEQPDACRHIFTKSEEKQLILVQQTHATEIDIAALVVGVEAAAPVDLTVFLPDLSTHTDQSRLACMASLLSITKHYYDYGMFCCGIKFIDLQGTREDWITLSNRTAYLIELFSSIANMRGLVQYLEGVLNHLESIAASFSVDQTSFWMDIFTQQNVGSGGDLKVNGWLKELYAPGQHGYPMMRGFNNSLAWFDYKNVSTGEEFATVHGITGANVTDDLLTPEFSYAVFRRQQ